MKGILQDHTGKELLPKTQASQVETEDGSTVETKLAAVRAVVDEGMTKPAAMARFGITSTTSLKTWLRAYREGGPDALRPKPKGRHKGTSSPPKKTTREQELERRIRKLEAENAYLKKSIALKAEKRSRTAIRRSS